MGCFMSKNSIEPSKNKPETEPFGIQDTPLQMKSMEYHARLRALNDSYKPPIGQTSSPGTSAPHSSPGGRRGSYMPLPFINIKEGAFQSKKFKVVLERFSDD